MSGWVARLAQSSAMHMAGAFVLMGTWAVFANRDHPMPAPVIAGIVQGMLSALITLGLKTVIETIARRLEGWRARLLPPLVAGMVSFGLLSAIHWAAGTPEIIRTVLLPLAVSTSYAAGYAQALWRLRRAP
ncbi:MAG: hypothetical protein AAF409_20655 [Pseudomonadota bacterium]